jgi:hypothetical protein
LVRPDRVLRPDLDRGHLDDRRGAVVIADPSFLNVLVIGMIAVIAVGATMCAMMLTWIAAILRQIERNQHHPTPILPSSQD